MYRKRQQSNDTPDLFDSTPSYVADVKEFIDEWNSKIWLPKIIITDRQCKIIRQALTRPFFRNNWRESFKILAKSSWLVFKKKPRLNLDWYLNPDNFDKIIEGFYITEKEAEKPAGPHKTARNGDEEEIL